MKKYEIIMQDEYDNLWHLGFYDTLEDSIKNINEWLIPYETKIDELKEYASTYNNCFDKAIETKDGNYVNVRGFIHYDNPVMIKHYKNEDINKELRDMLKYATQDTEWEWRFECGADFTILMDNIDKIIEYAENDYQGELYLNSNLWYICQIALDSILRLYGLRLIGEQKVTEHEKVVRIDENISS